MSVVPLTKQVFVYRGLVADVAADVCLTVTVVDVLKPKCLTCTLESAGGAEVNVIVVPDVV